MQQVAQNWLIYNLTGSAFLLGLNGLFRTLPFLGVSLYAGTLLDRLDRKRVLFSRPDILFGATRTTIIQLRIREDMRGRVMALSSTSMRDVGPFGSFQTGALASFIGVQWAIAVGAAVTLVMLMGAALRVPELRAFGRGDESERDRPVATGRAEPAVTAH